MSDVPLEIIKANNIPTIDSVFQGKRAHDTHRAGAREVLTLTLTLLLPADVARRA
jgi:hypothetical protein